MRKNVPIQSTMTDAECKTLGNMYMQKEFEERVQKALVGCEPFTRVHDQIGFYGPNATANSKRFHQNLVNQMDFADIERRMFALERHRRVDAALKLPRKHPARFALLYGGGPRTIERFTRDAVDKIGREVNLEASIQIFENWQANTAGDRRERLNRENAAIAYAAIEQGIVGPIPVGKAPKANRTPSGRHSMSEPEPQEWTREPGSDK